MIDFFKYNFPNLYEEYEKFLKNNNLKFIFKGKSETIGASTFTYLLNENGKNENFSISFDKHTFVNNFKGDNYSSNFLKIVQTAIHEMLHFITLVVNYDILQEQEIINKAFKNKELCFLYFLYGKDKLNNEDKKKFEERLKLLKNPDSEIYFNRSYCTMRTSEIPNICLTDFFMNNIVENMIEFLNEIEAPEYFKGKSLILYLESLTKQIYDSGKNKKYTIKIGEKILNFIKNYDNKLAVKFNESVYSNLDYYNKNNDLDNDDNKNYSNNKKLKIDDLHYYEDKEEE